ncbi:MAG TPA: sensor domain-containing protein [Gaiellaceae bacterium]|nr:sensor domain-containing protein [Gaiellaceae bacterium]
MNPARHLRLFAYLLTAIPLGAIGGALLLGGSIAVAVLAVTPLVVPALVAYRAAVGGLARLEAALANALLGTRVAPRTASPRVDGYWRRAGTILRDRAFWAQQAFFLLRALLGGTLAVAEATLLGAGLGLLTEPLWYRWGAQSLGSWHVDSLGRAFLLVPAGILELVLALLVLRPLGRLWRSLAAGLLGGGQAPPAPSSREARLRRRQALRLHAGAFVAVGATLVVIWAATTPGGYFWPAWALVSLGGALAVHAWTTVALERRSRGIGLHAGCSTIVLLQLVAVWALSGHGYFWPGWVALGLALALVVHWTISDHYRRQEVRIEQLETTRAGALDQQGADLRRIERDLHDGAQAQLVALGMSIGLAEQKLATDPAGARELLADARLNARQALEELRGLARGIHPPVLTDRGLSAAIVALADRTPLVVHVDVALDERPPEPVETAAYFVAAEALANAGKHAAASTVTINVSQKHGSLVVEVADDGRGGADPEGAGLHGLHRRVAALDGALDVVSPPGGGTVVRAVMPCES